MLERFIRWLIVAITNWLPVKVIRDDRGRPFLYRYHLFALTNDGPGIAIHHFVASDPDRGYHDHPWNHSISFILAGGYNERILNREDGSFNEYKRTRWSFNKLDGYNYHRVMIPEGGDAWTLFFFGGRKKTWGMIGLDGKYTQMSKTISDADGGWWNNVMKGLGVHDHLKLSGTVSATVDNIIIAENRVLLIKRGKKPCKGKWAFPGGRIEATDKDIIAAAKRELREETQLADIPLKYFTTVGDNKRDPRGFCVTMVYVAELDKVPLGVRAGDDAVDYMWAELDRLPEMAFDHKQILDKYKGARF